MALTDDVVVVVVGAIVPVAAAVVVVDFVSELDGVEWRLQIRPKSGCHVSQQTGEFVALLVVVKSTKLIESF